MPTSFFGGCLPTVFRPRGAVFTCGADIYLRCFGDVYLRWYRLHGGCTFEYTSGGSCGRACIIPPKSMGYLPPVEQIITSGGAEMFMPDGMGVYTSGGFAYTRRE